MEKSYQFLDAETSSGPVDLTKDEATVRLQATYGTKDGAERIDDLDLGFVLSVKGGLLRKKF